MVSFRPENLVSGGGLFEEGPGRILNPRFKLDPFAGKSKPATGLPGQSLPKPAMLNKSGNKPCGLVFDLEFVKTNPVNGQLEIVTEEQIYSCGDGMVPSHDGESAAPNGEEGHFLYSLLKKSLVEDTNWGHFIRQAWNIAPDVLEAVGFDQDVSVLHGLCFNFKRVNQPERPGFKPTLNVNPMAGAQAKPRVPQFVMPQQPLDNVPWLDGTIEAVQAAPKVAGASAAPAAAPVAAPAAAAPKAAAAKAPAKAAPKAAAVNGVAAAAAEVLMAIVVNAENNQVQVATLPKTIFDYINTEKKELVTQRSEILKQARDLAFIKSVPGLSEEGGIISLS